MSNSPTMRVTLACYYRGGKGGSEIKITSPKRHILEEIIQQDSLDRDWIQGFVSPILPCFTCDSKMSKSSKQEATFLGPYKGILVKRNRLVKNSYNSQ